MRLAVLLVPLLFLPLAGCLGGQPAVAGFIGGWQLPPGDPAPVPAVDCDDLLRTLNERALAEADALLAQSVSGHHYRGWGSVELAASDSADGAMAPAASRSTASARGAEVTGTNNQEADADEGDILKTDGEWTYVLRGGVLHVLHSENVGDLEAFGTLELEGHGQALLLAEGDPDDPRDDRLIVVSRPWNQPTAPKDEPVKDDQQEDVAPGTRFASSMSRMYWGSGWTRVQVLDLRDRSTPVVLDETWIEGDHVDARMIDGHAYIVVQDWSQDLALETYVYPDEEDLRRRGLTWEEYHRLSEKGQRLVQAGLAAEARAANRERIADATIEDHLPEMYKASGGNLVPRPATDGVCQRFLTPEDATGRSTTTIFALKAEGSITSTTTSIVGSAPIVYGTSGALVLAAPSRDTWWFQEAPRLEEATDLHWLDLVGLDVTHRASGRIPGIVQDAFGIDVHDGQLRVATTTGQWGRWWLDDPAPMLNHVAVLQEQLGILVPMGMVGGIAPGERIWSARFTDDRAYIITFEQIDPLWIIDLSDPTLPRILGELEIPGVSTYIHPLDDELLLAIGYGPGRDGLGLDWGRVQVSLFDISDPGAPRRAALLDITPPDGHSWSDATREHKAFTYWDALGVLALPVSTSQPYRGSEYDGRHTNVLRLIDVDKDAKTLSIRGDVDQSSLGSEGGRYYGGIERSYFLGYPGTPILSVYAMSPAGMTAHDLRTLSEQSSVPFEGQEQYGYCCWLG